MFTQRILFLAPAASVTRVFPQLRDAGFEVALAENLQGVSAFVRKSGPGIIFARPVLPGFQVEDLLAVGKDDPAFPAVVVITDKGSVEEAERLLALGARDYWLEPLHIDKISAMAKQPKPAFQGPASSTLGGQRPMAAEKGPRIVGSHPSIQRVLGLARQVAPSRATVLISGESGTGKEMFARTLHALSDRGSGPFVAINCAALPEHLLESELFGHEKGAFTGAIARKPGKFELASGGTLLLDEISEMDPGLQAKLLRVLQEGEVDRVGGTESVKVDVRVIATTNREMEQWVKEGKFRQDLYFRLNVIPLRLPSLKERGKDVLELAAFFINMYVSEYHLPTATLSPEAQAWLMDYAWPGNVRELQNLMERAVLLSGGKAIVPGHFLLDSDTWPLFAENESEQPLADDPTDPTGHCDFLVAARQAAESDAAGADQETDGVFPDLDAAESAVLAAPVENSASVQGRVSAGEPGLFEGAVIPLHEMERIMIIKGLEVTAGNRTQAADLLGISVRTLRNKLNEYRGMGIDIE